MSGFLFFLKTPDLTKVIYKSKIGKRFHSLLIPYVIWNIIQLIIVLVISLFKQLLGGGTWNQYCASIDDIFSKHGLLNVFWCWDSWGGDYVNCIGTSSYLSGPYNLPLWYLRNLIIISLLTPVLYYLLKKMGWLVISLLAILFVLGISIPFPGLDMWTLLFFSTGAFFAIRKRNIVEDFRKVELPCYILAVVLSLIATYFKGDHSITGHYFYSTYIITGSISAFNIASRLIERRKVKIHPILVSSVFFVYAFHTNSIVGVYDKVVYEVFMLISIDPHNLIAYITTPFAKAGICILIYFFIDKYLPRFCKVINGSR